MKPSIVPGYLIVACLLGIARTAPAQLELTNCSYGEGEWRVMSDIGGNSVDVMFNPPGPQGETKMVSSYIHYVDVGANGGALNIAATTITKDMGVADAHYMTSSGTFQGENGPISWTSLATLPVFGDTFYVKLSFSSDAPLGKLRVIQYLDPTSPNRVFASGTPGGQDFQLVIAESGGNLSLSAGAFSSFGTNMRFAGWAADQAAALQQAITGAGVSLSTANGLASTSLQQVTDARFAGKTVYTGDLAAAVAVDADPNAKTADITFFVGVSPDLKPVDTTPPVIAVKPAAEDEKLVSPVFTKFNTYLGQYNFLELVNAGTAEMPIKVFVHNLSGQVMNSATFQLAAKSQFDVDINTLVQQACRTANPSSCAGLADLDGNGIVDTYGIVRVEFDSTDPAKVLMGRMSNYRVNPDGSTYSFAFARELRNPSQGADYAVGNTYDPQGMGFLVPNWVEIINLENTPQSFTYNLYSQNGALAYTKTVEIGPLAEVDLQGGHEILNQGKVKEDVYLIELIPAAANAKHLMYVSRYSSNAAPGQNAVTYNYAFALDGRAGSPREMYAPITAETDAASCSLTTNWLEVVNSSNQQASFNVIFRDEAGNTLQSGNYTFGPKSQYHFNASAILQAGKAVRGAAEVQPGTLNSLVVQSLVYLHECDQNSLATAYLVPGIRPAGRTQIGSVNTFLNMTDDLVLISTNRTAVQAAYGLSSFTGYNRGGQQQIPAFGQGTLGMQTVEFPANAYGVAQIDTTNDGEVIGYIRRKRLVQSGGKTRVDFVMPTRLR